MDFVGIALPSEIVRPSSTRSNVGGGNVSKDGVVGRKEASPAV